MIATRSHTAEKRNGRYNRFIFMRCQISLIIYSGSQETIQLVVWKVLNVKSRASPQGEKRGREFVPL